MQYAEAFLEDASKHLDLGFVKRVVLPGENVLEDISRLDTITKLGFGLDIADETRVSASVAGVLSHAAPSSYWVACNPRWYIPTTGDQVVGVIEDKAGDFYKVNILSGTSCLLSRLGFEGATKRNKPELKVGDVVYCRVQLAHRDLDTELTCIAAGGVSKKEWSSGESVYGALNGGQLIKLSTGFCKNLLQTDNFLLATLAKYLPYEIAIGINGFVWFRTGNLQDSLVVWNSLLEADRRGFDAYQIDALVEVLNKRIKAQSSNSEDMHSK